MNEREKKMRQKIREIASWCHDMGIHDILIGVALGFAIGIAYVFSSFTPVYIEMTVYDNQIENGGFNISGFDENGLTGGFIIHGLLQQWAYYPYQRVFPIGMDSDNGMDYWDRFN
jgi:hypothetical protein